MFLKLYTSVQITKGIKNAIIFDTNTGFIQLIPRDLFNLLSNQQLDYSNLKKALAEEDVETLNQYIDFITKNNLGFVINTLSELLHFKEKPFFKENPTSIEYLIIDIHDPATFDQKLFVEIYNLNIKFLQIRIINELDTNKISDLISIIEVFNDSGLHEISVIVKYNSEFLSCLKTGKLVSNKFLDFTLHSASFENHQNFSNINLSVIKKVINIPLSCGFISQTNFNLTQNFHLEARRHNSCLYKKMAIDQMGNIKNCPSMPQSFGNIKDKTLAEVLACQDFKKYWNITKDVIDVCKNCEFRYICTDCRAYTEGTQINSDLLDTSKPLKCGYNPNNGIWEDWSKNPLKQQVIAAYGMKELITLKQL